MQVEFIPNQPIVFEKPIGDYPCLNNDPTHYSQLAQPGDKLCIQWKMLPCADDVFCESDMYEQTGDQLLKDWGAGDGWSSGSSSDASFDGAGAYANGGGTLDQKIVSIEGFVYRFSFTIDSITNGFVLTVEATSPFSKKQTYTQAGSYDFYFIATDNDQDIKLYWDTTQTTSAADTISISGMSCFQVTACWKDGEAGDPQPIAPSWDYSYDGTNGKFCSIPDTIGELQNIVAYNSALNYHGLDITVLDMTVGQLTIILGGTVLGTITTNGTYSFYGTPINASQLLQIQKTQNFDGCITKVNVLDYGTSDRFSVAMVKANTVISTAFTPEYFDDRIVFCKLYSELNLDFTGDCVVFNVMLYDMCDDENIEIAKSINTISYNTSGWDCTKVVESWSDNYAFGFYFGDIANPDFTLYQRLRVLQFSPKYANETNEYLYSSGGRTRTFAQSQKYRDCWFDYVDEYTHDCIRTHLLNDKLFIDGYAFFYRTEEYEPEWNNNGKYNLAQSRVELIHEKAIFGSFCGTQSNAQCPPQVTNNPSGELTTAKFTGIYLFEKSFDVTSVIFYAYTFDADGAPVIQVGLTGGPFNLLNAGSRTTLLNNIITRINTLYGGSATGTISFVTTSTFYQLTIDINSTVSIYGNHNVLGIASEVYTNYADPYWGSSLFMVNLF